MLAPGGASTVVCPAHRSPKLTATPRQSTTATPSHRGTVLVVHHLGRCRYREPAAIPAGLGGGRGKLRPVRVVPRHRMAGAGAASVSSERRK